MKRLMKTYITDIEPAGDEWSRVKARCPEAAAESAPGQFVQIRAWDGDAPLLNRPFSVAGTDADGDILLLIKKRGPATNIIAGLSKGSPISVIGPLGASFSAPATGESVFLVAGGVGIAPMRFYIQKHKASGMRPALFFGTRDSRETVVIDDPELEAAQIFLSTEDGSAGENGLVTAALEREVAAARPDLIITCGPVPMMKRVAEIAAAASIRCEVSMETYMSCGIGACMGCVVHTTGGGKRYFRACVEGPVVDAAIVDWTKQ